MAYSGWQQGNMRGMGRGLQIAGGALLLAGALRARSTMGRVLLAVAGSGLLYTGAAGRAPALARLGMGTSAAGAQPGRGAQHVVRTILVDRPADELYQFWRDLENLPRIMSHLESVRTIDSQRSYWRSRGPLGRTVEWEAEITHDVPNRELAWRSLPGAEVQNSGVVRFTPSPLGSGTQLQVEMQYTPPGGRLGSVVAWLTGEEPRRQLDDDLQRFKQMMEGRQIPTVGTTDAARPSRAM